PAEPVAAPGPSRWSPTAAGTPTRPSAPGTNPCPAARRRQAPARPARPTVPKARVLSLTSNFVPESVPPGTTSTATLRHHRGGGNLSRLGPAIAVNGIRPYSPRGPARPGD